MDFSIKELTKFEDERGFLIEFLKNSELTRDEKIFGQIYLTTIKPGCIRGNHYHQKKREFFVIVSGKASIVLEDIHTKDRKEFEIDTSGSKIIRVTVGPYIAHTIKNIYNQDVILCSYTDEEYDTDSLDQEIYKLI